MTVPNQKYIFTAGASGTRTWNTTSGTWAQATGTNFAEGDQLFYGGDSVVFNDPGTASTVTLSGRLAPASVSVNNSRQHLYLQRNGRHFGYHGGIDSNQDRRRHAAHHLRPYLHRHHRGERRRTGRGQWWHHRRAGKRCAERGSRSGVGVQPLERLHGFQRDLRRWPGHQKGSRAHDRQRQQLGGTVNWNFTGTGNGDIGFQNAAAIGGTGSTISLADKCHRQRLLRQQREHFRRGDFTRKRSGLHLEWQHGQHQHVVRSDFRLRCLHQGFG